MRKLYFVVRKDIPWGQRVVQVAHAVEDWVCSAFGMRGEATWKIVYGVKDLEALEATHAELKSGFAVPVIVVNEVDLDNQMTCLVTDAGPLDLKLL